MIWRRGTSKQPKTQPSPGELPGDAHILKVITLDELVAIDMRLQQISQQMAWLQQQVWQMMMMQGIGVAPSASQAPGTQRGPTAPEPPERADIQVYVDQASCRGCGLCVRMAPRTFRMDPRTGRAVALSNPGDPPATIQMAAARCPVGAIQYR